MPDPTPRTVHPLAAPIDSALANYWDSGGKVEKTPEQHRVDQRDAILAEIEAEYGPLNSASSWLVRRAVGECQRQDAKWGVQNHGPSVWLAILTEEVGELAEAILLDYSSGDERHHTHSEWMRAEAVQIAAVAVAFIEYLDRRAES